MKRSRSVHVHASKPKKIEEIAQSDELNLAPDVKQQLLDIQNKGLNLNQVLKEMLQERNRKIQEEKQKIAEELKETKKKTFQKGHSSLGTHPQPSRYVPAKIRHLLKQEFGDKCAQEICSNKAMKIHHTRRFGLNSSHNPLFLAPLCKQHHEIAHSLDVKVQEMKRGSTG